MKKAKVKNPLVNYENKWVALDENQERVILSANTLSRLQKKILKQKNRNLVVTKVMPFDIYLAPHVFKSIQVQI